VNYINQQYLDSELVILQKNYHQNQPFPNIAIDNFLTEKSIEKINDEFPEVSNKIWTHYIHFNERKHGLTKWEYLPKPAQELITEMNQPPFINWLEQLTGINNLFADPELEGSGLHQTLNGGFLNVHADFTVHPLHRNWQRRVNVLIYLNQNWEPEWGGDLELWDEKMQNCVTKISPSHNRVAIFSTGKKTYHGYPNPIKCPEKEARKSIAMYFYTQEKNPVQQATSYKSRPDDGLKRPLIWVDNKLISAYTAIKGKLGISDDFVSSILNKFSKTKQ